VWRKIGLDDLSSFSCFWKIIFITFGVFFFLKKIIVERNESLLTGARELSNVKSEGRGSPDLLLPMNKLESYAGDI